MVGRAAGVLAAFSAGLVAGVYLLAGDLDDGAYWLGRSNPESNERIPLIRARLEMGRAAPGAALPETLESLQASAAVYAEKGYRGAQVEAQILLALAHQSRDETAAGLETIQAALAKLGGLFLRHKFLRLADEALQDINPNRVAFPFTFSQYQVLFHPVDPDNIHLGFASPGAAHLIRHDRQSPGCTGPKQPLPAKLLPGVGAAEIDQVFLDFGQCLLLNTERQLGLTLREKAEIKPEEWVNDEMPAKPRGSTLRDRDAPFHKTGCSQVG